MQSSELEVTIEEKQEHIDVLVVGDGISGICARYYLKTKCQNKSFKILVSRKKIGGNYLMPMLSGIKDGSYKLPRPKKTRQGRGKHTKYAATSRNKAPKRYKGQGK